MRLKKEIISLCFIAVLAVIMSNAWCYEVKDTARISKHGKNKPGIYDNEYYYAFTSATKNAIFGQYRQAIRDFNECLLYKRNSPAIHYMLSSIYLNAGKIDLAQEYADSAVYYDEYNNKWYLLHLANIYSLKNEIDSSISIYEKLVITNPKDMDMKYKLALMYEEVGKYDKALFMLDTIEDNIGENENILISKHKIYSKTGKVDKAIAELKKAIEYYPENYNLLGLLAEYYADIKNYDEAHKYYNMLLIKDPDNDKTQLSYAEFLRSTNEYDKAFTYYKDAINNDNIDVDIKISLIVRFIKDDSVFNNFNKYIGMLVEAMKEKYNDNVNVRTLCADFYIRNDELEKAEDELNSILAIDNKSYIIWEQLLYIENSLGKFDSVINKSTKALKIFKEEPVFYLFKGIALIQTGINDEAVNTLEEGIRYAKEETQKMQFYNFLAEAYRNVGDFRKSDNCFEKVLEIDPDNLLVRNNYSYYLALRKENLKKAEELSRLTIEEEPRNYTYLDTYGWILFRKGEKNKARKFIEKALKYGGDKNSEILDHYGDILYELSDSKEAVFYWNEALKYSENDLDIMKKIKQAEEEGK
jgi:tetratricopeptide (TPR) repeat protein